MLTAKVNIFIVLPPLIALKSMAAVANRLGLSTQMQELCVTIGEGSTLLNNSSLHEGILKGKYLKARVNKTINFRWHTSSIWEKVWL